MNSSNKNAPGKLAERIKAEAEKEVQEKIDAAAREMAIAQAWDACGFAGLQPWHVSGRYGIYGDTASLSFRDAAPDDLAALMIAFPAIPRVNYSDNRTRYFHPIGYREIPPGATVTECDGYEIEISGGRGSGSYWETLRASWSAMVGDIRTHFSVDIRRVHWLHPRTHRRSVEAFGHTFLRYEGPASLVWPREFSQQWDSVKESAGLVAYAYNSGESSSGDFRIRGVDVAALALAWQDEANRRNEETREAFERAYSAVESFGLPSKNDIGKTARKIRAKYKAEKLRAGTLEQTAALQTEHALADRAVAEKHWPAYTRHHDIETRQGYFDHYAWACAYLRRVGLYQVPVTEEMRASATGGIKGDVYTYGHRWL